MLDAQTLVSDSQVTGAAAVSTNSYDLGPAARQVGTGSPLAAGVAIEVAPTGVSIQIEVISATNAALTAGVLSHGSMTVLQADAPIGKQIVVPVPNGAPTQRYLGLRYTVPAGTATVSAWFAPADMISVAPFNYPKGYAL